MDCYQFYMILNRRIKAYIHILYKAFNQPVYKALDQIVLQPVQTDLKRRYLFHTAPLFGARNGVSKLTLLIC